MKTLRASLVEMVDLIEALEGIIPLGFCYAFLHTYIVTILVLGISLHRFLALSHSRDERLSSLGKFGLEMGARWNCILGSLPYLAGATGWAKSDLDSCV